MHQKFARVVLGIVIWAILLLALTAAYLAVVSVVDVWLGESIGRTLLEPIPLSVGMMAMGILLGIIGGPPNAREAIGFIIGIILGGSAGVVVGVISKTVAQQLGWVLPEAVGNALLSGVLFGTLVGYFTSDSQRSSRNFYSTAGWIKNCSIGIVGMLLGAVLGLTLSIAWIMFWMIFGSRISNRKTTS